MDFMTSNSAIEGTLASAFRNSLAVLMDDGKSSENDQLASTTASNHKLLESQQQQPQQQPPVVESISKTSTEQCSPYDTLYWLGGDCMRSTAATSLSTIAECTTMKTDNTTDLPAVSLATKEVIKASIVSQVQNSKNGNIPESNSNKVTNDIDTEQQELPQQQSPNSVISSDMNTNVNADIISQFHRKYSNPRALFDDKGDYMEYTDPVNSLLVDDPVEFDAHDYIQSSNISDKNTKTLRKNNPKSSSTTNNSSIFCLNPTPEAEAENWFTASPVSTTSWCGGYPSLLMYNNDEDMNYKQAPPPKSKPPKPTIQYPDYYAEFKPQRQYAFDEEDKEPTSASTLTPTGTLLDGTVTTSNDGDSLVTAQGSVQSFMVINKPHTNNNIHTPLTRKLQRNTSRRVTPDRDHHLHKLIASSSASIPASIDSDCGENTPLDYALTQSLMRKLQKHLPYGKKGDSFWLQYSLLRDGASLDSLLDMVHKDTNTNNNNNVCTVLAIETIEGEVFGAFLTQTWRRSYNQWYGGGQSFLWTTAPEEGSKKNKLRVFPYSFANSYVQLCDRGRLLVGGGDGGNSYEKHCYGFGLALEKDLVTGSSCPCTTFQSPSLSKIHSDGSTFEIRNVEVWTLTPCLSVIENPSEGLVRVHKRQADQQRQMEQERQTAKEADAPPLTTIISEDKSDTNDDDDDDSFEGFYSCSDCHNTKVDDGNVGDGESSILDKNVNEQFRKHRNRYISTI